MFQIVYSNLKKPLNRHDAKVAKGAMFRTLDRRTRKPVYGAFRSSVPPSPLSHFGLGVLGALAVENFGLGYTLLRKGTHSARARIEPALVSEEVGPAAGVGSQAQEPPGVTRRGDQKERALRRICAWCGAGLGEEEPLGDPEVTRTICTACAERLAEYRKPVLVVSRSWTRLYDELLEILKDRQDIQVVLDRRDPTRAGGKDTGWDGPDRRRSGDPLALK